MKIQVSRLRNALELVEPAVPKRATLPVLSNVRLGQGRVVATDLEVAIMVSLPEAEEDLCLPYRGAGDFLKAIPGIADAILSVEGRTLTFQANYNQAQASFVVIAVEDYPPIPSMEPEHEVAVDGDGLLRALTSVLPCVATESSRPVLTAVCLTLGENPEVAGADGFRLGWEKLPGRLPGEGQLLIPARAVGALAHLWRHAEKPPELSALEGPATLARAKRLVRLEYRQDRLKVSFGEVALLTQLIQGTYPNYRQLIPSEEGATVTFMAEDLYRVVTGMANLAKEGSGIIRLQWSGDSLRVEVRAVEVGSHSAELPCRTEGEGRIAFNRGYLLDYLSGKEGTITLTAQSPSQPGLFAHRNVAHFCCMPMFIRWDDGAPGGETTTPPEPAEPSAPPPAAPAPKKRNRKR